MTNKISLRLIAGFILSLSLSSCAKQSGDGLDAPLSFSADTPELVEVKAAAVTSVSDFYAMGYGTTQWFPDPTASTDPVNVVIPGSQTFGTYKWKMGDTKTFFAYSNNLPSGASASIASSGVTLTYTAIPTEVSAQTDVTLGRYTGNGSNTGTAAMTFYHPLAQVVFKMGDMAGVSKINKIEISGVYNAGTTKLSTTTETTSVPAASGSGTTEIANFSWTGTGGSAKVSQTVNSLPATGDEIGIPFMLIPQDLATQNVTVTVTVTTTGGSSVNLTTKLESGTFATGKKTVCTLTVNPDRELTCTLVKYVADDNDDIFPKAGPKPNEIWYWTKNEQSIFKSLLADANDVNVFGANMVSSIYTPGDKGIMKFDGPITKIGDYAFGTTVADGTSYFEGTNILNLTKIAFPEGVIELGNCILNHAKFNMDLEEIIIPRSVTTIQWFQGTFAHTYADITVGYINGITYTGSDSNYIINLTLGNGQTGKVRSQCFLKCTLITLADGSKKKVEDISYDDELLVWNFDKGCYDKAKILWLTKDGLKSDFYYKCTFSDGTVLNIVGNRQTGHRLFNATDLSFDHCNEIEAGKDIFTEHGNVKLVSCELIDSVEVEYVNLITDQHINCFANEVLASARYNNRWPIDEDMKFVKDGRKIRPYKEFRKAGISRQWYDGMRLGEQQDSIARVKAYIDRCELNGNLNPDWKQPGFFARIWNWIKGLFSK